MNKTVWTFYFTLPLLILSLASCLNAKEDYAQRSSLMTPSLIEQARSSILTLSYDPTSNEYSHLFDFRLPATGKPPYPLIVYIHGGAWCTGDKYPFPSTLLVSNGYATASINYRLTNKAPFPAQIEDCKKAIAWLRSHAHSLLIDPNRIGVWGCSAGGHLVALLGTTGDASSPAWAAAAPGTSNKVTAVCDWCGPTDFLTMAQQSDPQRNVMGAVAGLLGGSPSQKPRRAQEASPITYTHKGSPPFLIMHGDQDSLVPIEQSRELHAALLANGVDCTFQTVHGEHNFYKPDHERTVLQFFDRTLKEKQIPLQLPQKIGSD